MELNTSYYSRGVVGRLLWRVGAFLQGNVAPIGKVVPVFKKAHTKDRAAIVASALAMGTGGLFQKRIPKALVLGAWFFAWLYLTIFHSAACLNGDYNNAAVDVGMLYVLITAVTAFVYVLSLSSTIKLAQSRANGERLEPSALTRLICDFAVSIRGFFKNLSAAFSRKSVFAKASVALSFVVFGIGQMLTRQLVRGIILLAIQVGIVFFMLSRGIADIESLFSLRSVTWNDESRFCLVYGLVATAVLLFGIILYFYNLRNVVANNLLLKNGQRPEGIFGEIKALKEGRFYQTLLIVPIGGVLLFTVLPLVFMICIAFTGFQGDTVTFDWTGFDSFKQLILLESQLKTLIAVTGWTMIWAFFATFTCYFGGILLALLINKKNVKGKTFWRTMFIITMATPQFVSLMVMNQIFTSDGAVNLLLQTLNITNEPIRFWSDPQNAKIMIIVVNMWVGIPFQMVLLSGILANIPADLYESAKLEGANKFQQFMKITMPYMLYVTAPLLITGFVHNLNNFNVIWLLTEGQPYGGGLVNAGQTDILITWLYRLTKTSQLYNMSAAIGIIMFIISATLSITIYRNTASYKKEGQLA